MKLKRILTGVIGLPIVAAILIFGNKTIVDIVISLVALIAINEYFNAIKKETNSNTKYLKWLGYISCILICFLHLIPTRFIVPTVSFYIILIIAEMFLLVLLSKMKIRIVDVALAFWGIVYIVFFLAFIPLLYGLEGGKFLVWYIFISAWGTDTFAYFTGMKFGKHKFSKISPKKSIEGCIGGVIGSTILMVIFTIFVNKYTVINIPYWYAILMGIILSILSQVGDFSASAIKRTAGIKDFGKMFPGHGGMLDRIDSLIFIAPFAYFLIILIG